MSGPQIQFRTDIPVDTDDVFGSDVDIQAAAALGAVRDAYAAAVSR